MTCYNDNVLFIHIPKCGGYSVREYLSTMLPDMKLHTSGDNTLPLGHMRLNDIERHTGRPASSFREVVAVIRNPYAQQVSQACFWAGRYLAGARTPYETATWRHVRTDVVGASLDEVGYRLDRLRWEPSHIDMGGFVSDLACDVHAWCSDDAESIDTRRDRDEGYDAYGGFYRYWLTVEGEIPSNVTILQLEDLDGGIRDVIGRHGAWLTAIDVPKNNTTKHLSDVAQFYTKQSAALVERKFAWAFDNHYEKLRWN